MPYWDEELRMQIVPAQPKTLGQAMDAQKLALFSVPWQALRVQLKGSWGSVSGVRDNLKVLGRYLDGHWDNQTRLWQVTNLLNAVRMGYSGMGLIDSDQDRTLITARSKVRAAYSRAIFADLGVRFEIPTEDDLRRDWAALDVRMRVMITDDLIKRRADRNWKYREEASWFLTTTGAI
jgi:hypothetical protein